MSSLPARCRSGSISGSAPIGCSSVRTSSMDLGSSETTSARVAKSSRIQPRRNRTATPAAMSATSGSAHSSTTTLVRGFELLNLQGGIDFPLGPTTSLGPFVTWTLSRFDKASASCNGDCGDLSDEEQDIEDKALHHWVFVGARFSLFP
jgi:hypothetical protein